MRYVDEVSPRIDEVIDIVAAIPVSVLADHVDHSEDDLIARIKSADQHRGRHDQCCNN